MIWYLAHPISGDPIGNAQRALRWLRWIRREEPEACIIAPWIAAILSGADDSDPKERERGLRDCDLVVALCDGVVAVGGRISSGMQREIDRCADSGGSICDLTRLGDEPPSDEQLDALFAERERRDPYAPPSTVLELGQTAWEAA